MSAAGGQGGGGGAVLRGVPLDAQPRVLRRPGAPVPRAGAPGGSAPVVHGPVEPGTAAPEVPPERLPGYPEGFRAGFAQGEAAQNARELATIEAAKRMAFEQGREEGRQQGLMEGREAGRAAVEQEARAVAEASAQATAVRLGTLDRLIANLPAELTRRLEQAEDDMVALCHAVVCRLLGDELAAPAGIAAQVRQAIRDSGPAVFGSRRGALSIHVNPGDLAPLEADPALAGWLHQHASAGAVEWVADERVRMGGCVVRSAEGSLDARLETQLEALGQLLRERRAADPAGAAPGSGKPGGAG